MFAVVIFDDETRAAPDRHYLTARVGFSAGVDRAIASLVATMAQIPEAKGFRTAIGGALALLVVSNGVQKGPPIGVEEGPPFRII